MPPSSPQAPPSLLVLAALSLLALGSGCLRDVALDARGWACADDSECGALRCLSGVCGGEPGELAFPIRAAFYSGWAAGAHDAPSLGPYSGDEASVIASHLAAMEYGKIQVPVVEWSGPGSASDRRLPTLLAASAGWNLRWAVLHYGEMQADPSPSALAADLDSLADRFAAHPNFLRLGGRFVVFVQSNVSGPAPDDCSLVARWNEAVAGMRSELRPYLVVRAVGGQETCSEQPDAWFARNGSPAAPARVATSFGIFPGIWPADSAAAPTCRDLARWYEDVRAMTASSAQLQVVTSFNDWTQGSAVESSPAWASASGFGLFLDALHSDGQGSAPPATFADCP